RSRQRSRVLQFHTVVKGIREMAAGHACAACPTPASTGNFVNLSCCQNSFHPETAGCIGPVFITAIDSQSNVPFGIASQRCFEKTEGATLVGIPPERGSYIDPLSADIRRLGMNALKRQPTQPRQRVEAGPFRSVKRDVHGVSGAV